MEESGNAFKILTDNEIMPCPEATILWWGAYLKTVNNGIDC